MGSDRHEMVHSAATISLAGLLGVVFVLGPGPIRRWAIGGVALLVVGGGLYALFGDGDWTTGGDHRRHAIFILVYGVLAATGSFLVEVLAAPPDAVGRGLHVIVIVYAFSVGGWLAYLDGTRVLARIRDQALGRVCSGRERADPGGD